MADLLSTLLTFAYIGGGLLGVRVGAGVVKGSLRRRRGLV